MSNTFYREARWFLGNLALFLALAFAMLVSIAIVQLGFSSDEAVTPGWSGVFPVRVLESALAGMLYFLVWIAPPVLAVVLAVYRAIVMRVQHPRVVAYLASAMFATLLAVTAARIPSGDERWIVLPAAGAFAYAAILRLPGDDLLTLPGPIRGSVIGLALSFAWLVGPLVALAIAIDEYRNGRHAVAGWILAASSALPAILFVADLWRDDVPGLNYVITTAFVTALLAGIGLIVRSSGPAFLAKLPSPDP